VGHRKTAGKSKLGGYVIDGRMTLAEAQAQAQSGRKAARREARKARDAYSDALDEVRAMRQGQGFAMKAVFPSDLAPFPTPAEEELAAVLARTRQQQALVTKAAKRPAPAGPSPLHKAWKAAAEAHEAAEFFSSPPVVTRQLSGPERRIVAVMAADRDSTRDPGRREALNDQIARIKGLTPSGAV
jgi:hypothetical protein